MIHHDTIWPFSRRRRALALVTVLWVTAILTLIITVTARTTRQETLLSRYEQESIRAKWAVRAGIDYALCVLAGDTGGTDTLNDVWGEGEPDPTGLTAGSMGLGGTSGEGQKNHSLTLPGCQVTVRFYDESAKLNMNIVSVEQLRHLPAMTPEAAAALIDWRDGDDTVTAGGAESPYYQALPYPYRIRNKPFKTVGELLQVAGVDSALFYGEDTNLNGRLDYNENDGQSNPPLDNEDALLDRGLAAWLTCYTHDTNTDSKGADRVNVNSADEGKLREQLGLRPSHAQWIVQNRPGKGYASLADLVQNPGKKEDSDPGSGSSQPESLDLNTFIGIVDRITLADGKVLPGRVNINTAGREVLTALLEGDGALAETILSGRQGSVLGYSSIGDLLRLESFSFDSFRRIANSITTRSHVFTIECQVYSLASGAMYRAWAVVDRDSQAILYSYYE